MGNIGAVGLMFSRVSITLVVINWPVGPPIKHKIKDISQ